MDEIGYGNLIEWQSDGHRFIREHVAVQHQGKVSLGLITKWAPAMDNDPALWHMVHNDGDEEDLDEGEVRHAIELYRVEAGQPQVSKRGQKRPVTTSDQEAHVTRLEEIETKLEGYRAEWLKEHPGEEISSTNFPVSLRRLLKEHQQLHKTFESMTK